MTQNDMQNIQIYPNSQDHTWVSVQGRLEVSGRGREGPGTDTAPTEGYLDSKTPGVFTRRRPESTSSTPGKITVGSGR